MKRDVLRFRRPFIPGGVHVSYADGHAILAETIDGGVYASLASPQGMALGNTPVQQPVVSDSDF